MTVDRARVVLRDPRDYPQAEVHCAAHVIFTSDEASADDRWLASAVTTYGDDYS